MPTIIQEFRTPSDYWLGMVEPDYEDCLNQPDDLRAAFHAANSLFHMHDWIWKTHEATVSASFTFVDALGATIAVHDARSFANALEQQCPDFGRVRGIANAAKHLAIRDIRPVDNAPSHAANTAVQATGWGEAKWGVGTWGGSPRVMLAGPNGSDMEFSEIAKAVYEMWVRLRTTYSW